jgi:hypothetical protein
MTTFLELHSLHVCAVQKRSMSKAFRLLIPTWRSVAADPPHGFLDPRPVHVTRFSNTFLKG